MMKQYYIYIMASKPYGVFYIGVTNNLIRRVWEHRTEASKGFTRKYYIHRLVYFEITDDIITAIQREKQIKHWGRQWKIELINKDNPSWKDLYEQLL